MQGPLVILLVSQLLFRVLLCIYDIFVFTSHEVSLSGLDGLGLLTMPLLLKPCSQLVEVSLSVSSDFELHVFLVHL